MDTPAKSHFFVTIDGAGMRPDTVAIGDLVDLLLDLEKAVIAGAGAPQPHFRAEREVLLSLVGVSEGSDRLKFAIAGAAIAALVGLTSAMSEGRYAEVPTAAHQAFYRLFKKVSNRDWTLSFESTDEVPVAPLVISAASPVPDIEKLAVVGPTELVGELLQSGGRHPKVQVLLRTGEIITPKVSKDRAIEFGHVLYRQGVLIGNASWRMPQWEVVGFELLDFRPFAVQLDPVHMFDVMSKAAAGHWDGVDAADFVRNMRHEDDETA